MLTSVTDSANRVLTLKYSGSHLKSVTDANVTPSRVVRFKYDSAGDLVKVTDVNGEKETFRYTNHEMSALVDPACTTTVGCPGVTNKYDSEGRVQKQTDAMGRVTTFSYSGDPASSSGGTTTITDPMNNVTQDEYEYGELIQKIRGVGTPEVATTNYVYDPNTAEPTLVTDPDGTQR